MAKKTMGILEAIEVAPVRVGTMEVWLKGITPLILNRMASKAKRELLLPGGRKTKADKEQRLKHDPMAEYRDSMTQRSGNGPTRVLFPAPGIKKSMSSAALETKGTNKTQIGRLVWVKDYSVGVYGVPQLHMGVVKSADMNKTPDIRTRGIIAEWCIPVTVQFVKPQLSEQAIAQLLCNGGIMIGIGDWRQEKGSGNFGQFEVATKADCKSIIAKGGIKVQDAAIKNPSFFDADSEELYSWFTEEVKNRGKQDMLAA